MQIDLKCCIQINNIHITENKQGCLAEYATTLFDILIDSYSSALYTAL